MIIQVENKSFLNYKSLKISRIDDQKCLLESYKCPQEGLTSSKGFYARKYDISQQKNNRFQVIIGKIRITLPAKLTKDWSTIIKE